MSAWYSPNPCVLPGGRCPAWSVSRNGGALAYDEGIADVLDAHRFALGEGEPVPFMRRRARARRKSAGPSSELLRLTCTLPARWLRGPPAGGSRRPPRHRASVSGLRSLCLWTDEGTRPESDATPAAELDRHDAPGKVRRALDVFAQRPGDIGVREYLTLQCEVVFDSCDAPRAPRCLARSPGAPLRRGAIPCSRTTPSRTSDTTRPVISCGRRASSRATS